MLMLLRRESPTRTAFVRGPVMSSGSRALAVSSGSRYNFSRASLAFIVFIHSNVCVFVRSGNRSLYLRPRVLLFARRQKMKLILGSLLLAVLSAKAASAQDTPSVSVENTQFDKEKELVTFDVRNLATKPIRAWTATITLTNRRADMPAMPDLKTEIKLSSDGCRAAEPDSFHCAVNVAFGDPASTVIDTGARVSAVLFEDGTTEGDPQALNQESSRRHALYLAADYWLKSLRHIRGSAPPVAQLEAFSRLLVTPDPSVSGIALRNDVDPSWESMRHSVADAMRRVENGSGSEAEAAALEKTLGNLASRWKKISDVFPWRGDPAAADRPGNQIDNRVSGLNIVKTENRDPTLIVYVRNDYLREIAGYAIGLRNGTRDLAVLSGGAAIVPGEIFHFDVPVSPSPDVEAPALVPEILCVVFKDRTGDGDPEKIRDLNEDWAGRLSSRAIFISKLHALVELPGSEIPAAIEKLAAELQDLPELADATRSPKFMDGARFEVAGVRSHLWAICVNYERSQTGRHASRKL